jgi:hypothetical protein
MDSLEERIVEALDHDDELFLGHSRSGPQQESCSRGKQKRFLHVGSPPLNIPFVRHAPLQAPASRRWPAGGPRHPPKTGNRAFSFPSMYLSDKITITAFIRQLTLARPFA